MRNDPTKKRKSHDPESKARGFFMLLNGATIRKTAEECGVSPSTAKNWSDELKARMGSTTYDRRSEKLEEALFAGVNAIAEALTAQAKLLGDPSWLQAKTAQPGGVQDVVTLTEAVSNRVIQIVRFAQGPIPDPEQFRSIGPGAPAEPTEAEIVDE